MHGYVPPPTPEDLRSAMRAWYGHLRRCPRCIGARHRDENWSGDCLTAKRLRVALVNKMARYDADNRLR